MNGETYFALRRSVATPSGRISYVEQGQGPVALFVHGVLLNGYLWRHQLAELSDTRRCIAVDLLAHGYTEAGDGQDVSVTANAHMLAQIFAALYPQRIRSLALSNCDAHDNWPPEAFKPFVAMVAAGGLGDTLRAMLADKSVFRTALAPAYERPEQVADATIDTYLRPLLDPARRLGELERFVNAFDCRHTLAIEDGLRRLQAPTLIAWGSDDVYFPLAWSIWLQQTIPGTVRRVEFDGARIFFPEERWQDFNRELRAHWQAHSVETADAQAAIA